MINDQLAFANVLAIVSVYREYFAIFVFEDTLPLFRGGLEDTVRSISNVKGPAVLAQAIPQGVDFDVIQPMSHLMDVSHGRNC